MFADENVTAGCPTIAYEKKIIATVSFRVVDTGDDKTIISSVVESDVRVSSTNPPVHATNGSAVSE